MSGFLYFVPHVREAPSAQRLIELGLADAAHRDCGRVLPGHSNNAVNDGKGPGGAGGWIVGPVGEVSPYQPAAQTWVPGERWWLGFWNERKPTPADLLRTDWQRGTEVTLGDGQGWTVPVAKLQPGVLRFEGGKWVTGPAPESAALFAEADRLRAEVWEKVNAAAERYQAVRNEVRASGEQIADELAARFMVELAGLAELHRGIDPQTAVEILARNYRVGAEEVSALGLLRMDPQLGPIEVFAILDAFVDGAGIRAARAGKKN